MSDCKKTKSPTAVGAKLLKGSEENIKDDPKVCVAYREAIGALTYLTQSTRPDIAFAVNAAARFCEDPRQSHWEAVKKIFRYLNGTCHYKLIFTKTDSHILGYSDADYAADENDRISQTGYVFIKAGGAICWSSTKQKSVSRSSLESEYYAMSEAAAEAEWLSHLEQEIELSKNSRIIYADNQSAIMFANNNIYSKRTKHIDVHYHYVRQLIEKKKIKFEYINTKLNIADAFTKAVTVEKLNYCSRSMGLTSE